MFYHRHFGAGDVRDKRDTPVDTNTEGKVLPVWLNIWYLASSLRGPGMCNSASQFIDLQSRSGVL